MSINPESVPWALSSLRRGLKGHVATDIAARSKHDIVTAIGEVTKIGKRGAAQDLRKFSRTFCEWRSGEVQSACRSAFGQVSVPFP